MKILSINASLGCSEPERTAVINAWWDKPGMQLTRYGDHELDIVGHPKDVIELLATVGITPRHEIVRQIVAAAEAL